MNGIIHHLKSPSYPFYIINVETLSIEPVNDQLYNFNPSRQAAQKCHVFFFGKRQPCQKKSHCPIHQVITKRKPVYLKHYHHDFVKKKQSINLFASPFFNEDNSIPYILCAILPSEYSEQSTATNTKYFRKKIECELSGMYNTLLQQMEKYPSSNKKEKLFQLNSPQIKRYELTESAAEKRNPKKFDPLSQNADTIENYYTKKIHKIDGNTIKNKNQKIADFISHHLEKSIEQATFKVKIAQIKKQLNHQKEIVETKDSAFRELLHQVEKEKLFLQKNIKENIEELLLPPLEKLKKIISPRKMKYIQIIHNNITQITSSFGCKIKTTPLNLSRREIDISNMIRNGLTSKEIAKTLSISCRTVDTHRIKIRKKLGLTNKNINLTTFLTNL